MSQLFVPILVNDEIGKSRRKSLFSVTGKTKENNQESNSDINGWDHSNSNPKFFSVLDKKLENCFPNESFSFEVCEYGKVKIDAPLEKFSENMTSISLGILCSAYIAKEARKLKEKYDSITVTGNFNVIDGKIFLSEVTDIKEKYKTVQDYANKNANKKHLFLYVFSEEMILGGWHDNVFVIPVSQKDKIECVFAEIFETTDVQKHCIQSLPQNGKGYIETAAFIKWKKELVQNDCNGFLLHGASQSGKSIAAVNLCKYMIATTTVEEVVWITISDNNSLWDKLHKGIFPDVLKIIKEEFSEQLKLLDRLLDESKKCCLIFDNIEGDFTDKILSSIKNEKKYKSAIDKKILKIIITTWKNTEDKNIQQDLQMQEKNCETLVKTQEELEHIVYSAFENAGADPFGLRDFKENQNRLLEMLYGLCFEEEKSFPGRLSISVASIMDKGIAPYIERYSKEDFEKLTKMTRQFRIDFECLDPMSQFVLFAFLGINKFKNEIDIQKICEIINKQIFNGAAFVSEQNIIDSVNNLIRKGWIHENKPNTKNFYVKTDTIDYCVFSAYEKNEIAKNLVSARNVLIPPDIIIKHAIQNNRFEIFEKLIKAYNDKEKINELFIRCIECDRGINYLKILDEKGIDPEYLDEDGDSAIDVVWCKNPDMEILNYLLEKGFKPRKRIPIPAKERNSLGFGEYISPLALVCDKGHVHLVKYVLANHLYEDINGYIYRGRYTALQFNVLCGDNVEILDLLIKAGADISLKTRNQGWSFLTCTVLNEKHPEVLEYILKEHIYNDIEEKDNDGYTALQLACRNGKNSESVRLLLDNKANRNVLTAKGRTLLHLAAKNKNSTILEYILREQIYNAIDEKDNAGETALFYVQTLESFKLLLEHGANPNVVTSKGNNILHAAVLFNRREIVEYILKHLPMVSRNQKNLDGKTPADLAKSNDIKQLFEKL